jgi:hypothetical protein
MFGQDILALAIVAKIAGSNSAPVLAEESSPPEEQRANAKDPSESLMLIG